MALVQRVAAFIPQSIASRHFALVEDLVQSGGPAPEYGGVFSLWLEETADLVARGTLSRSAVHEFWASLGADYLGRCIQGRALAKHYGYAGDFALIDDVHCARVSSDPRYANWDRFLHETAAARAVRNRAQYLAGVVDVAGGNGGARVLVLSCGPCRDVATVLRARPEEDDLAAIAMQAGFGADEIAIGSEAEGVNLFLHVRKS